MRYFIFNCFGEKIGNPKGYRTYRGAARQETILYPLIWDAVDKMKDINPTNRLVCSIKLLEA